MQSMIGRFNLATGEENDFVTFSSGDIVFYEKTNDLNYTIVSAQLYKYDSNKFFNSIQQQLMYFKDLNIYKERNGKREIFNISPKIIYEDEDIIMSDNWYYSKPHILVNDVNYGFIDYERIFETEQIHSNIGIKCKLAITDKDDTGQVIITQEGLQVTPNRESIINDSLYTRQHLTNKIELVAEKATKLIDKSLNSTDFLTWLKSAQAVVTGSSSDEVLKRMRNFVGNDKMTPKYPMDTSIKFNTHAGVFFNGLQVNLIQKQHDYKTGKDKVVREGVSTWGQVRYENIYLREEDHSFIKDLYLKNLYPNAHVITIKLIDYEQFEKNYLADAKHTRYTVTKVWDTANKIYNYFKESKEIKSYEDVNVPDDWRNKFKVNEDGEVDEEAVDRIYISPEEKRRLESRTVCFSLKEDLVYHYQPNKRKFIWDKKEPKIDDIENPNGTRIVWGLGKDEELVELLTMIVCKGRTGNIQDIIYNDNFKLYRVSDANRKPFKKHSKDYITKLFKRVTNDDIIETDMMIRDWWTSKLIYDRHEELNFLLNYKSINPDIYELYQEVMAFYRLNYVDIAEKYKNHFNISPDLYTTLIDNCQTITNFQLFVDENDDAEEIKQKSLELFKTDILKGGKGVNLTVYKKFMCLLEYASSVKDLFNEVNCLITTSDMSVATEMYIHEIVKLKGLHEFQIPKFEIEEEVDEIEELQES